MPTIRPNFRRSETDAYLHLRMLDQLHTQEAHLEASIWAVMLIWVLAGCLTLAFWLWCLA